MKIYIGHATGWNFEEKLYKPVRESKLADRHEIVFPHDSEEFSNSKKFLKSECDLFVAEVSRSSTGLGIELGWAEEFGVPVVCVHREGSKISGSVGNLFEKVEEYENFRELISVIEIRLEDL